MRWSLLALFFLLFLPANALVINEIMYDPSGTDEDREWVELYNNESAEINLTNWRFLDPTERTLVLNQGSFILGVGEFAIVTENITQFFQEYNFSGTIFVNDAISLANGGDNLGLKDANGAIVVNITYVGNATSGNTLQFVNGTWCEGNPTPGANNSCMQQNTSSSACDLVLDVNSTKSTYNSGETIYYDLNVTDASCSGTKHNYSITYWIEDFFGGFLKSPANSTYNITCSSKNTHQKQAADICGTESYLIKAQILNTGCNDSNSGNNYDEFLIAVKGKDPSDASCQSATANTTNSAIIILDYPEKVLTGEQFKTKIELKNNNNSAQNFSAYSYIFESQKLFTEGGWSGNKKTVELAAGESRVLELQNTVKSDAEPGVYSLRARATFGESKADVTKAIEITQGNFSAVEKSAEISSFYTRTRNLYSGRTINLYARVENFENQVSEFALDLVGVSQQKIVLQPNAAETFQFNATLQNSNSAEYVLNLVKDDAVIDSLSLKLELSGSSQSPEGEKSMDGGKTEGLNLSTNIIWSAKSNKNLNVAMILFIAALLVLVLALLKSKQGGPAD